MVERIYPTNRVALARAALLPSDVELNMVAWQHVTKQLPSNRQTA